MQRVNRWSFTNEIGNLKFVFILSLRSKTQPQGHTVPIFFAVTFLNLFSSFDVFFYLIFVSFWEYFISWSLYRLCIALGGDYFITPLVISNVLVNI